ncbi:hypothetical protein [Pseudonocardia oroxyli]|uniref:Molybdenum ABC transporter substrate-binding protein n=1 Tax=Pseudonocardia oroxyli TaxID=366584 RepID=A0A1G8BDY0_PSEOR|nr:hypothetical protein [Pseudonocardia oroxyli]SDH31233.1 hypothetical protein SAMN05216377_1219 [Pseudonocardia oroxyli]
MKYTRILTVGALMASLAACSAGPAGKAELCESFDQLGTQLLSGNGIGNPLFRAADSLGDVAERYSAQNLGSDAKSLHAIADSDGTDSNELRNATMNIAKICGHPLGLG